jgi:hypothetical protein
MKRITSFGRYIALTLLAIISIGYGIERTPWMMEATLDWLHARVSDVEIDLIAGVTKGLISSGVVHASTNSTPIGVASMQYKEFQINLAQAAGTYTLCSATGSTIFIGRAAFLVTTAGTGFTNFTVQTNNTTADLLLASTTAASTTILKNLGSSSGSQMLPDAGQITYTITGTGTAGTVNVGILYSSLLGGSLQ